MSRRPWGRHPGASLTYLLKLPEVTSFDDNTSVHQISSFQGWARPSWGTSLSLFPKFIAIVGLSSAGEWRSLFSGSGLVHHKTKPRDVIVHFYLDAKVDTHYCLIDCGAQLMVFCCFSISTSLHLQRHISLRRVQLTENEFMSKKLTIIQYLFELNKLSMRQWRKATSRLRSLCQLRFWPGSKMVKTSGHDGHEAVRWAWSLSAHPRSSYKNQTEDAQRWNIVKVFFSLKLVWTFRIVSNQNNFSYCHDDFLPRSFVYFVNSNLEWPNEDILCQHEE